jgi:hypothetical protein
MRLRRRRLECLHRLICGAWALRWTRVDTLIAASAVQADESQPIFGQNRVGIAGVKPIERRGAIAPRQRFRYLQRQTFDAFPRH